MLFYWSRRQFDGDIYSLWTYDVNGMATNSNSRVYLLLGVASILIFLLWSRSSSSNSYCLPYCGYNGMVNQSNWEVDKQYGVA